MNLEPFMKPQALRLWDVFFLGPMLIYSGTRSKKLPPLLRGGLVVSGILTMGYNGRNYLLNEKMKKEAAQL